VHISAISFFGTNAMKVKLTKLSSEFNLGNIVKVLAIVAFGTLSLDKVATCILKVVFSGTVVVDHMMSSLFHVVVGLALSIRVIIREVVPFIILIVSILIEIIVVSTIAVIVAIVVHGDNSWVILAKV